MKKYSKIHFTGIKGVGMAALACCAQDLGIKVSGSDTDEVFPTDKILRQRKIHSKSGFSPQNLPRGCDLVIYTGAHGGVTNPEVVAAVAKNIPVLSHAQALELFTEDKKVLAVAGVGGKSTTSAMLATILDTAGLKPSFAVGVGNISPLNTPGRFVKNSPYFVVEADEYVTDPEHNLKPRFHYLKPHLAILTNLEHDHPDVYPSLSKIFAIFRTFIEPVPSNGAVIVNLDNLHLKEFITSVKQPIITYGFTAQVDWQIVKTHVAHQKQFVKLQYQGLDLPDIILNVPGDYNASNAAAAAAAAYHLGVTADKIQKGLKQFKGTKRRFEHIAAVKGIDLYDDYAHHPIEIQAVLKAARQWLPQRRILVVFQSHTYSRTKALLPQFAQSFDGVHQVIINDIFASAREKDDLGISGEKLTEAIKKHRGSVFYCPDKSATLKHLKTNLQKGDVILTLGAGNNWLWHKDIIKLIKK